MTEPTQAQITEAVKLKFKFAKGPVIYGGELAELIECRKCAKCGYSQTK